MSDRKDKLTDGQALPMQFRTLQIKADAPTEADDRTVRNVSVSSDEPYERYFGTEILKHDPASVDLSRISAKAAPLLYNHDRDALLGKVNNPRLENGRLLCDFKFSSSERAKQALQDLREGILTECSIGYSIERMDVDEKEETYTATRWGIHEVSLVTVPADFSVGVGRDAEVTTKLKLNTPNRQKDIDEANRAVSMQPNQQISMATDTTPAPQINVIEIENAAVARDRKRVADIQELSAHFAANGISGGRKIDTGEAASDAIRTGKTLQEFQDIVVRGNFKEAKPVDITTPELGMSAKEKRSFSIVRAISQLSRKQPLDGIEREASDAHAKLIGREVDGLGFFLPQDIMRGAAFGNGISAEQARALFSNVYSGAGAVVGTDLLSGSMIELLRNQMAVVRMGARSLSGLRGNVAIPKQTGGATASWLAEDSTITATQQTVGQLNLTPHKLAAATAYTNQLLIQASIDVENFVRQDLMAVIALKRDLAAINGSAVSGEPKGILAHANTTELSIPVTLSGAQSMTYANAVQFETNVALNNAVQGRLGYLTTPTVKGNAKLVAEISAANSVPVWKNDQVNGYPAFATNQMPTATSTIFGNWDDLVLADWSDTSVLVDPYSLSLQGQIRVILQMFCDNGIRHAASFSASTN